ncbi:phage protease [Gluconacetobacter sp.]|uniref:phage protease n=1 Tax=Gluconacetobacter sp. TaxID=1935994 RepID=UPI0039E97AE5
MTLLHFHTMLPDSDASDPPAWIHLLPTGAFKGIDGRGPYRVGDASSLITNSMQSGGGKLTVDENHSTDRAMVTGGPAPAVGYIVEMQERPDGIWGRMDWTPPGVQLWRNRAYRGVSPAFAADPDGRVTRLARASLTNTPNLNLTSLHSQEPGMTPEQLRTALGLAATASDDDVTRALAAARASLSLHGQVAQALGLEASVSAEALVTGLTARVETSTHSASADVAALRTEVTGLRTELSRRDATAALDKAAREGAVISQPLQARLLSLHMADPAAAEDIIAGLPRMPGAPHLHTIQPDAAPADVIDSMAAALGNDPSAVRSAMRKEPVT